MYHAIVFLPLVGFLAAGLFGRQLGARGSEVLTTSLLAVSALLSWVAFFTVTHGGGAAHGAGHDAAEAARSTVVHVADWMSAGDLKVSWSFRVDTLTAVMLVVVTTVSALVHLYSIGYMHEDPSRPRFFAYLSLFTFTMLMLVTADDLVQMFFGWEGVGLASYLLIGFWYDKPSANAAALKAFVVNRVGDFGYALGIFALFALSGSVQFDAIFAKVPEMAGQTIHLLGRDWPALEVAALLLFMGACGKSAQLGLHTWLPDAMEGPTPVSALIHAATMVTAGVFMVARMSPVFEAAPTALGMVTVVGAATALFAATVGLVQNDIKRVVAYSTCSQLGYMFVAHGVGAYGVGIFHLFTHAFFKALLFLGAGSVIHAMHHEQDMRRMGGLARFTPLTAAAMAIGTLALTGFPFTAGYYSKDAIIEAAYASDRAGHVFAFLCTVIAAGLTAFYSWRLFFLTFTGPRRWEAAIQSDAPHDEAAHLGADAKGSYAHGAAPDDGAHGHAHTPHESPRVMLIPLGVLAFGALFAGLAFEGRFIGHDAGAFWAGSIRPAASVMDAMHGVPGWVAAAPTVMLVLGFGLAYLFYVAKPYLPGQLAATVPGIYSFLVHKWWFDELYDRLFVGPAKLLGRFFWKQGDGRVIDGLGPDGLAAAVAGVTRGVVRVQTGYLYHYAFAMLLGVAAFVTWYVFGGAA